MNILIAGDFCPQYRVPKFIEEGNYEAIIGEVRDVVTSADYSIVNFECAVSTGVEKPIEKCGPHLQCSEQGLKALKWAGFDCVTLANNHFYDFGDDGVKNTLSACEKYGLDVVGGGKDLYDASKVLYKEINGKVLAVINCCEHEFSIATGESGGSNPLNPIQQYYAIKEAKEKADYVLIIVHGGHEYYPLPSPRMQETYRFFVDAGADAVINHHQHCYSGYEVYKEKPIFYGLGNFCFDNGVEMNLKWSEGYMVIFKMDNTISFEIIPYRQCYDQANVRLLDKASFNKELNKLYAIINDPNQLKESVEKYYESCSLHNSDIFEPCYNKYYLACKSRGWLPSLISKARKVRSANYICCESHRDKLIYYLNHK